MPYVVATLPAAGAVVVVPAGTVSAMAAVGAKTRPEARTAAIAREATRDFMEVPFTSGGHGRLNGMLPSIGG